MNKRLATVATPVLFLCSGTIAAATFTIIDGDGPGEGFNDTTPVSPVGNNPETTLGAQRLFAVQWAADIWGALLESPVDIEVIAAWDDLECTQDSGVLGSAGPRSIHANFGGAQVTDTWYPQALANSLSGSDLFAAEPGIGITMNKRLDDGDSSCLRGRTWYYGLDPNTPSGQINVLPTILHELAHGLGFISFVDLETGKFLDPDDTSEGNGPAPRLPDIYSGFLSDTEIGADWLNMTDQQRAASAINDPDLVWTGPNVTANASSFVGQASAFSEGFLRMHAPDPLEPGSSVSHWALGAWTLLMEPELSGALFDEVDLTIDLFGDIGWQTTVATDVIFANGFE